MTIAAHIKHFAKKIPGLVPLSRRCGLIRGPIPHGQRGIRSAGHREYVGGLWDEIGTLQFEMMLAHGLLPHHNLCDVACGSLRGGRHFIHYLEPGRYFGIDKEQPLIDAGIDHEIGPDMLAQKRPEFVLSSEFEFDRFSQQADYALAQSLFTHLPAELIETCIRRLRKAMHPGGVFLATFFHDESGRDNPTTPHDHGRFAFTEEQMIAFGEKHGWRADYIGDWSHPRGQVLVKYTA